MTDRGYLLSGAAGVALLICMFAFAWYGVVGAPGSGSGNGRVFTENAWQALIVVRWLMLVTILFALGGLVARAGRRARARSSWLKAWIGALGAVTSALLIYRVLIDLPSASGVVDQKLGALLGVMSALGIMLGGLQPAWAVQRPGTRSRAPGRRPGRPSHGGRQFPEG